MTPSGSPAIQCRHVAGTSFLERARAGGPDRSGGSHLGGQRRCLLMFGRERPNGTARYELQRDCMRPNAAASSTTIVMTPRWLPACLAGQHVRAAAPCGEHLSKVQPRMSYKTPRVERLEATSAQSHWPATCLFRNPARWLNSPLPS